MFDLRNEAAKQLFYESLRHTKWSLDEYQLEMRSGLLSNEEDAYARLSNELDITSKTENLVLSYYSHMFQTLAGSNIPDKKLSTLAKPYPEEFAKYYPPSVLQKLVEPLLWVKVQFPVAVSKDIIGDLVCCINTFPIINRRLNDFSFRLMDQLNIVPLASKDIFYDLKSIYSSNKMAYTEDKQEKLNLMEAGNYALRRGGVARFDARNAQEILAYVVDLLRDESASFSVLGNDFISSNIKQLNQLLAMLNQKLDTDPGAIEQMAYVLVKPKAGNENISVEFWSTSGAVANNIRVGSKLSVYAGSDVKGDSVVLMTTSTGGKEKLNSNESLLTYKKALLTRDKIVTQQDVLATCKAHLGDLVRKVEISKGYKVSHGVKQGISAVVNVKLIPSNIAPAGKDWETICHELSLTLNQRSSGLVPYEVSIAG